MAAFTVSCPDCGSSVDTDDGDAFAMQAALNCLPDGDCCLQDHHHQEQAEAGSTCRPVVITVNPQAFTAGVAP